MNDNFLHPPSAEHAKLKYGWPEKYHSAGLCRQNAHHVIHSLSAPTEREREGGEKKFKVDIYRMNHFIINALPFSDMKRVILLNCKN